MLCNIPIREFFSGDVVPEKLLSVNDSLNPLKLSSENNTKPARIRPG
jgi:hypothetical protein